ncbi:MAG: glycosyltransferase [Saprospiraceae bacterium]|nr:glycosyltransferase [Saprospiraceae bacterium]
MDPSDRVLLIFIKNPELGKVKTRLAKDVGPAKALEIYNDLLEHTRNITVATNAHRILFYSSHIDLQDQWPSDIFEKRLQVQGDLGEKMVHAFQTGFQKAKKVVIIGSDCPQLSTNEIEKAFTTLDQKDVVIGPALDGGYYLLGMKSLQVNLFQGIPWSTEKVADLTLEKVLDSGKTCHLLKPLSDIDYLEDWQTFGSIGKDQINN